MRSRHALLLVAAVVAAVAAPGAGMHNPGPLFQGLGPVHYVNPLLAPVGQCSPDALAAVMPEVAALVAITVEVTPQGSVATVEFSCPLHLALHAHPVAAVLLGSSSVFLLEGDWATGFTGTSIPGLAKETLPGLEAMVEIGPYGDGHAIPARGTLAGGLGGWSGTVADLAVA